MQMFRSFGAATRRRGLVGALMLTSLAPMATMAQGTAITRVRFSAQLGAGFVTEAEFTRPAATSSTATSASAGATDRLPAVLLVHGATPADMDFTVRRSATESSTIFRDIADSLSARGIAVLRYHKRWVRGPGQVDFTRFAQTDLQALLADARTMLDSLRARPDVDPRRIFVWGWSEGSGIVAQIAAHDTAIAGVIAHGPVVSSYAETLRGQFRHVGVPHLLGHAASDSTLGLDEILRAVDGAGGMLARSQASFLLDPMAARKGERKLNVFMDTDSSGRIHVVREALPLYERFMTDGPAMGMYASVRALPGWGVMVDSVRVPILVLEGESDANIPVGDVRQLEARLCGRSNASVRIYPGLGHSLGRAASPVDDDFRPVDAVPLRDAARWILAVRPVTTTSRAAPVAAGAACARPASPRDTQSTRAPSPPA